METLTVQEAQQKLQALIENASSDQQKYCITSATGNAVLLSEETYHNLLITLEMLSTPLFLDTPPEDINDFALCETLQHSKTPL